MAIPRGFLRALAAKLQLWLQEPLVTIFSTLRDPLHRHELRQQSWWRTPTGMVAGLVLLLPGLYCFFCCPIAMVFYAIPAALAGDGLLSEIDRGTLEHMLVTPLSRVRWLWAKLLARLRGILLLAIFMPVIGAMVGAVVAVGYADEIDLVFLPPLIGLSTGLLLGAVLGPLFVSSGAIGLAAVLYGRTRMKSLMFSYLFTAPLYLADAMFIGGFYTGWAFLVMLGLAPSSGDRIIPESLAPWLAVGLGLLTIMGLALRAFLYIGAIPAWILRWSAQNLDEKLLAET